MNAATPAQFPFISMANATFRSMTEALDNAELAIDESRFEEADSYLKLFSILEGSVQKTLKKIVQTKPTEESNPEELAVQMN